MSTREHAGRVVEAYAKGIICSGEVFNQYVAQVSEDTIDTYMEMLSPELILRFEQNLAADVANPVATPGDVQRRRHAQDLIEAWLRRRNRRIGWELLL